MAKRTLDAFFKPAADTLSKKAKTDPKTPPEPTGPPENHPSYPIPIPQLPSHITVSIEHGTPTREGRSITNQPDLDLLYFQPYIARTIANELFKFLRRELPFYRVQYNIKRNGIDTSINTPRYTTIFGVDETASFVAPSEVKGEEEDEDRSGSKAESISSTEDLVLVNASSKTRVSPSKYQYTPRPVPGCLATLRKHVEAATGAKYNFCLVNYYANGEDSITFHSDDERFLGSEPCIASLSLGGEREFVMKHKPETGGGEGGTRSNAQTNGHLKMPLGSGDMVIMRGSTQANWLHSIPKRKGRDAVRGRINITFRRAMIPAGTNNYYNYNVGCGPVYRWDEGRQEMVEAEDTKDTAYMSLLKQGGVEATLHGH